jgi:hypothetical protein
MARAAAVTAIALAAHLRLRVNLLWVATRM